MLKPGGMALFAAWDKHPNSIAINMVRVITTLQSKSMLAESTISRSRLLMLCSSNVLQHPIVSSNGIMVAGVERMFPVWIILAGNIAGSIERELYFLELLQLL